MAAEAEAAREARAKVRKVKSYINIIIGGIPKSMKVLRNTNMGSICFFFACFFVNSLELLVSPQIAYVWPICNLNLIIMSKYTVLK